MATNLNRYVDAWEQTIRSVSELVEDVAPPLWERPTDCPGWSVRDQVSHIIGVERELLGELAPFHQLPRDLRHIQNDFGRHMEVAVNLRRHHTPPEVTWELYETIQKRVKAVRAELESGRYAPDDTVTGPGGIEVSYSRALSLRAFDVWVHEQDIRRAVGRPGNLDAPAAEVVREIVYEALPRVIAKDAAVPPGSVVRFTVTGPYKLDFAVTVDAEGHGGLVEDVASLVGAAEPTVRLGTDWETFVRLVCGRVHPNRAKVTVAGDEAVAGRVLAELAVTP